MFLKDNSIFKVVENPNKDPLSTKAEVKKIDERIKDFAEIEATFTKEEAENELSRCYKCPTKWCENMCPAGVPVRDFIELARRGQYSDAYKLIRARSTLPEFCSRLCPQEKQCRSNCTRSINSEAVASGGLERYVVEEHYVNCDKEADLKEFLYKDMTQEEIEEAVKKAGRKNIAVVGSGPAGLSCAQRLLDYGYGVTLYEKNDRPGGLLTYGIPNMKLEKGLVERKIGSMKKQGMEIKLNAEIVRSISRDELIKKHDALIIAVGSENARRPEFLSNEEDTAAFIDNGIIFAKDFLENVSRSCVFGEDDAPYLKGKNIVIVGGGDTGSDCVGTALRLGAETITQVEMLPEKRGREIIVEQRPHKEKAKKKDFFMEECMMVKGDPHIFKATVKSLKRDDEGCLKAAEIISLKEKYDSHFRLTMEEIKGSEREIPCDLIIIAAGFTGPDEKLAESLQLDTDERGNFKSIGHKAGEGKVFVCGDCKTGQSLVVKAMKDGRDAADEVHEALK